MGGVSYCRTSIRSAVLVGGFLSFAVLAVFFSVPPSTKARAEASDSDSAFRALAGTQEIFALAIVPLATGSLLLLAFALCWCIRYRREFDDKTYVIRAQGRGGGGEEDEDEENERRTATVQRPPSIRQVNDATRMDAVWDLLERATRPR
jgi:hypothetical protein